MHHLHRAQNFNEYFETWNTTSSAAAAAAEVALKELVLHLFNCPYLQLGAKIVSP